MALLGQCPPDAQVFANEGEAPKALSRRRDDAAVEGKVTAPRQSVVDYSQYMNQRKP